MYDVKIFYANKGVLSFQLFYAIDGAEYGNNDRNRIWS